MKKTTNVGCFGRLAQRLNEVTGRVQKTVFDEEFHAKTETAENNRKISVELAEALAQVIQPDAVVRIGKSLQPDKDNKHENLAKFLSRAGSVFKKNNKVSEDLLRIGDAFKLIGMAERKYIDFCEGHTLDQLKRVLGVKHAIVGAEHTMYRKEKKGLELRRLEMDRIKHKVQKNKEFERDLATATVAFDQQLGKMEELLANNSGTQQTIYNELYYFVQEHVAFLQRSVSYLENALKKARLPEAPSQSSSRTCSNVTSIPFTMELINSGKDSPQREAKENNQHAKIENVIGVSQESQGTVFRCGPEPNGSGFRCRLVSEQNSDDCQGVHTPDVSLALSTDTRKKSENGNSASTILHKSDKVDNLAIGMSEHTGVPSASTYANSESSTTSTKGTDVLAMVEDAEETRTKSLKPPTAQVRSLDQPYSNSSSQSPANSPSSGLRTKNGGKSNDRSADQSPGGLPKSRDRSPVSMQLEDINQLRVVSRNLQGHK